MRLVLRLAALALLAIAAAGAAPGTATAQIMGGTDATIARHPWQVALSIRAGTKSYQCGGSLIAERWVLTAAHCIRADTAAAQSRVKAGATRYRSEGDWTAISRIVVHEAYDARTQANDIALVELVGPTSGEVIALAGERQSPPTGEWLEITGWGATAEGGAKAAELQLAFVPLVDQATCNAPASYDGAVLPGMLCAGLPEGGIDACQGDSGGPLVWRSADGPVLVGIVSHGEGCGRQGKYGVYTDVAAYRDWIDRVLGSN